MKFSAAIEIYIRDMRSAGRINSDATERSYRSILNKHCDDISNRDPRTVGRTDVKATLGRWPKPNTQRVARAILVSFYDWTVEEGYRPANPARQTRRPRKQPTNVYRLTRDEAVAMLQAAQHGVEQRAIFLGMCAGLRNAELRGLQGRHFRRPGFIWVSADIGKGNKERWVPVIPDLVEVFAEIAANVPNDRYVLPAQRWRDPGVNTKRLELDTRPMSPQGVYYLVGRVGQRAGIHAHTHPHLLRHAFGDHVAKGAGLLIAQALLGHSSTDTTRGTYVGKVTLDDLAAAVAHLTYGYPSAGGPENPLKATTGIEPVSPATRFVARVFPALGERVALYSNHFAEAGNG
jgi:integrase